MGLFKKVKKSVTKVNTIALDINKKVVNNGIVQKAAMSNPYSAAILKGGQAIQNGREMLTAKKGGGSSSSGSSVSGTSASLPARSISSTFQASVASPEVQEIPNSTATAQLSFFEKNKKAIMIGGGVLAAGLVAWKMGLFGKKGRR